MSRCSTIAKPGLISYLPSRLPFPRSAQNITALACLFGLEAKAWTLPSSPSSLDTTSTAYSFDEGQTSPACPCPWHRLHSSSVQSASNGPSCHTCSISSREYYLRWLWRYCYRHRQPRPSHHRPRWCLCRLVLAVPDVHLSLCHLANPRRKHRSVFIWALRQLPPRLRTSGDHTPYCTYHASYHLATRVAYTTCTCLLYTSPSPRDRQKSRMPSSA